MKTLNLEAIQHVSGGATQNDVMASFTTGTSAPQSLDLSQLASTNFINALYTFMNNPSSGNADALSQAADAALSLDNVASASVVMTYVA